MSETHISYEVSKRLKEFLEDSAPEPISPWCWTKSKYQEPLTSPWFAKGDIPAYQLHDLLSKPFCEAMSFKTIHLHFPDDTQFSNYLSEHFRGKYYHGGLPAVEKCLLAMMEAK